MIVTGIIIVLARILYQIISLFPTGELPTAFATSLTLVYGYAIKFNEFFPIDTMISIISVVVIYEMATFVWRLTLWPVRLVIGLFKR